MSDPAKSANEIEDVLASIRRLVSESHSGPAIAVRPAAETARLVLTPAQRVTDPDDPWAPVPSAEVPVAKDAAQDEDVPEDPAWGLEDRLSDWGEIEGSAQEAVDDAIAEQADEAPPAPTRASQVNVMADEPQGDSRPFEFESETGDADWPDQGPSRALRDLALVRGHAGPIDAGPFDEPAGGQPEAAPAARVVEDLAQQADLVAGDIALDIDTAAEAEADLQATATADGITRVFSRRVEVRRPMMDRDMETGPSEDGMPEEQGLAAADADEIEDDIEDDIEDLGEDTHPFTFPDTEDGVLDEETLREIIAEVVREELQGALGQRITRNVRKMVRREIRLALAAQDLE